MKRDAGLALKSQRLPFQLGGGREVLAAKLARLEERLRRLPPFSHLGAYLIALAER